MTSTRQGLTRFQWIAQLRTEVHPGLLVPREQALSILAPCFQSCMYTCIYEGSSVKLSLTILRLLFHFSFHPKKSTEFMPNDFLTYFNSVSPTLTLTHTDLLRTTKEQIKNKNKQKLLSVEVIFGLRFSFFLSIIFCADNIFFPKTLFA